MTDAQDFSPWGKLKRRLEQAAQRKLTNNSAGHVVVSVCILMDAHGQPLQWAEPSVTKVEPANRCDILRVLAGDTE
jgi:energy-converting hydrogenase A subunit M